MVLATNKIRIKLKSYNHNSLDTSCEYIIDTINQTEGITKGPIPLPTQRKIYCVLRSPHVNKASREHFELKVYKRLIDIYSFSSHTVDALMQLNLPAGVDIEVKL